MAGAAVIAKIPIGSNNHFVQVLPGRLNIVQFQSPFELNPDFILNFEYNNIIELFDILSQLLIATEKRNETVVEEITLNDKVVFIYLCALHDQDTHTFVITRDISQMCTNVVTRKNIEEGELILQEEKAVPNFFLYYVESGSTNVENVPNSTIWNISSVQKFRAFNRVNYTF